MPPPSETALTKNYRLVYEIVLEQVRGTHLAAADVFALAKTRQKGIGFTTVYRALARLCELGWISEISLPGAQSAYYEITWPAHAHFRCDFCGDIEDVDYALPREVVDDLVSKHRLDVQRISISLHGTCRQCTGRAASPAD
jgi:Fe2+ or Zn2+ uptake regulation protein